MNTHKIIFILFCFLTACTSSKIQQKEDQVNYLYIYDKESENETPIDSMKLYDYDFEKSLELYSDVDSFCKQVYSLVYLSVFQIENQKFAIIVDSNSVATFKFDKNKYNLIERYTSTIGVQNVSQVKIDVNNDGYKDILLKQPSQGTFGDTYFCFFYNHKSKTLVTDTTAELRNIELDLKNHRIKSNYDFTTQTDSIVGFQFIPQKSMRFLGHSGTDSELEYKVEVIHYKKGKIVFIDTIDYEFK